MWWCARRTTARETEPARTTGGPDRDTQNPARGEPGPG
ncbi:hypothetical protein GA0115280_107119 [Streptomyces sp. Cmuel-A718b]|nr:hypothetical protein GA0115280_107119 [Streptomyces sp. Cmuel-A718b]